MRWRLLILATVLCLFSFNAASQATASNLDSSVSTSGDFVLGRQVTSTFDYEINDPYKPVDTALVIDESGSMGGVMQDAKDGAKSYVENTRTASGDENAVVEFESSASTVQSLTGSKKKAKDAIEDISSGGGTDLPAGVDKGADALDSGTNSQQVMIVLADGDGGNPSTQADDARDEGIEIHGIMYGSDASTSEFEGLTDSDCSTNSDENDDGDNCWYAESGTIDQVYNSIRESTEVETDASLRMRLRDFAYETDSYDNFNDLSGSNKEFIRSYQDVTGGTYSRTFEWRPTSYGGNVELVTGDSVLRLSAEGDTDEYNFAGAESKKVHYVDFDVTDYSVFRSSSGIGVNFTVENKGNVASKKREVWVADGLGPNPNRRSLNLESLSPGESSTFELSFDGSNVFADPESVYVRVDPVGVWGSTSYGEGEALEPDEQNNIVDIGYPPKPQGVTPSAPNGIEWGDSMQPEFRFAHENPGNVDGVYNFTNGTSRQESDAAMSQSIDSGDAIITPDKSFFSNPAERWYNYTVRAEDQRGAETVYSTSYYVENPKPTASALNPRDGGTVTEFPVDLSTRAKDENSRYNNRKLDVTIFDADTGNALAQGVINPGGKLSYTWNVPNALTTTYQWKVQVTDKWDSTNRTFSFTKVTGSRYRTDLDMEMNYSSLSVNSGNNRYTSITLRNNVENEKDLTLELKGVEAEFLDGSDTKDIQNFDGQSTKTYTIRVNPESVTDEDLTVVAVNNKLGIETKATIPVTSLPVDTEANEVPGIGVIQLLFLVSAATVLYSVRL